MKRKLNFTDGGHMTKMVIYSVSEVVILEIYI